LKEWVYIYGYRNLYKSCNVPMSSRQGGLDTNVKILAYINI